MQVNGKVTGVLKNNRAMVEITRASACGENCVSCGGCSEKKSTIIAEFDGDIEINDEVFLEMSNNKFFKLSILIFILPILSIIVFYQILTFFIANADIVALLSFFIGISIFLGFILYSRRLKMPKCSRVSK